MTIECLKCHTDNPEDSKFCKECATPFQKSIKTSYTKTLETPTEDLIRGTLFADRYEIIEKLGKGGMGRVYRVEDTKIKQEIALKLINPEIATDKMTIERFKNELKTARNIRHKNVCGMFDLGEEKGTYFITMEFVSGETLKSFIKRSGQLSIRTTIRIVKQICAGLSEAHRLGIVHRDLKPSNIMIDSEGCARIMDFGIARSLIAKGITGSGVMIGTPEYMSVEQAEAKDIDLRSDIYSLGVILYEMVVGRLPFDGETPLSIAIKHKTKTPEVPRKINPQIPDDLSRLILKCLKKKKESRYKNTEELISELVSIEESLPTTDRAAAKGKSISSLERTGRTGLKKFLVPVLTFVAVAAVAMLGWLFIFRGGSLEPSSETPLVSPRIEELHTAGMKYWGDKNFSEAIQQFRDILSIDSENIDAMLNIAVILEETGKIDEAILEFEKVIVLNQNDPRAYFSLAEIHEQRGETEQSVFYYQRYLDFSPKDELAARIRQKVENIKPQILPKEKQKKQTIQPVKVEKEKTDMTAVLDKGTKAFNGGNYAECIKLMEEVLRIEQNNSTALYFLSESNKRLELRQKEEEINNILNSVAEEYQENNFEECIRLSEKVLQLDQNNSQALNYLNSARKQLAPMQIEILISLYSQSVNNNNIESFYEMNCSSQLFESIKRYAEFISMNYKNLQSRVSGITIQFQEDNRAEVRFSNIITGVSKDESEKQVIFEGSYTWNVEKQGNKWKITDIISERNNDW